MSTQQSCWISLLFHAMVVSNKLIRSVIKLANGMKVWWVTPTPRAYKRPSAGRTLHTQLILLSFSTREQPQQPTPCVATTETTTAAWAVAAMAMAATATAMAAWAVVTAPATALALATTIEDATEDSHPLHLDTRIHQLWSPRIQSLSEDVPFNALCIW